MYTAAYRDQHGEVCPVGSPTPALDVAERFASEANADDPNVLFFVAYLGEPQWRQLT